MRIFFILLFCLFVFSNIKSQIGWVGNMWPASGNINQGSGFTIYIEVWKGGVTDTPGQGDPRFGRQPGGYRPHPQAA